MSPDGPERDPSSRVPFRISRRTLLALMPGLVLLAAGVACGGDDDDDDPASTATSSESAGSVASPTAAGSAPSPTVAGSVSTATLAPAGTATTAALGGEWSFTDDRGVTITLPKPPERIVAQTTSAAVLWDFGIRPVGVFGPSRLPDGTNDFQAGDIDFDSVEVLGDYGGLDLEKLVALDADLYVDLTFGGDTLWYLSEDDLTQVGAIVPTLGISMQKMSVLDSISRFEELSASLGVDLESPELSNVKATFTEAETELKEAIAGNPGLKVLVLSPTAESVYIASPDWMVDLYYFRELGLDIVTHTTDDFFELISFEQINQYPADLFLIDARTDAVTAEIAALDTWQSLPAVQADQIGPWYAGAPYSYARLTPIMQELAEIIRGADASLV